MQNITQREVDGIFSVSITMELAPGVNGVQALAFFKRLEFYIRSKFLGVRDFYCVKNIKENHVSLTFTHLGYIMEIKDKDFSLLESELKLIKR